MLHTVKVDAVSAHDARTEWMCTCGQARTADNIAAAASEAHMHLRDVYENVNN